MFTISEKKILKEVHQFVKGNTKVYNFWFVYDIDDVAINFEGGYELSEFAGFRNEYYIEPGEYQRVKKTPLQ